MSRSRYSSQEVFLSEVQRLQKERTRLLRQRNHHQFPKDIDYDQRIHQGISHRETQQPNQNNRIIDRNQSPRVIAPNIQEVKTMLEDIMKNSERHGMNQKMSLQYLKDIQLKLTRQIEQYNRTLRRTVQSDKLRDLKVFVDKLVLAYEPSVKTSKGGTQKMKLVKQGIKRTLQRIPESVQPSISMVSQSSELKENGSQYKSSQYNDESSESNIYKHQTAKKATQHVSNVLDLLQNKLFGQVTSLRSQNVRLRRQLQQLRQTRSHSRGHRKNSIGQNQTIINQLVRNDPKHLQSQNHNLKNRIRGLEMQLLRFKSLRNIDAPLRSQQRLHEVLQQKDNEIQYLRKQIQNLIGHLQNSKQQVQYLRTQASAINNKLISKTEHQKRLNNNIRSLQSQVYRLKSNDRPYIDKRENKQEYYQRKNKYVQNQKEAHSYSNQKQILDSRKLNIDYERDNRLYKNDGPEKGTKQSDSLGEYRQVLFTLRSLRK